MGVVVLMPRIVVVVAVVVVVVNGQLLAVNINWNVEFINVSMARRQQRPPPLFETYTTCTHIRYTIRLLRCPRPFMDK